DSSLRLAHKGRPKAARTTRAPAHIRHGPHRNSTARKPVRAVAYCHQGRVVGDNRVDYLSLLSELKVALPHMTAHPNKNFDATRLARIILPKRGEPRDVRSLYIVENESTTTGRVTALSRTECRIPA